MPQIQRFSTSVIRVNPDDHNPPHFHVILLKNGREAMVATDDLAILRGGAPTRLFADALDWAAHHRDLLLAKGKELNP